MTTHKPRRAALYARVSDDASGRDKAVSIGEQIAACEKLIRERGDRLVITYIEDKAYRSPLSGRMVQPSAKRPDRPEWVRLLAAAGKEWDVLYAWRVDRICRGNETAGMFERILDERRIGVELVTQAFDRDSFGLLAGGVSGYELRSINARMMMGREGRVRGGLSNGKPPHGYEAVRDALGKNVGAVLTDTGRAFLSELARLFLAGAPLGEIGRRLGPSQTGKPYTTGTINLWLRLPFYRGVVVYGRRRPEGQAVVNERPAQHETAWDADTIRAIDAELARRAALARHAPRVRRHDHLLAGVLHCGYCGQPLTKHTARNATRIYLNYGCNPRRNGSENCPPNHISETAAIKLLRQAWATFTPAAVDAYLDRHFARPASPLASVAALASLDQLEAEAAELSADLAHASSAGARLIEARLSELRADIASRTAAQAEAQAQAAELSRAELRAYMLHVASLASDWDTLPRAEQAAALRGYPPIYVKQGQFVAAPGE